MGGRSVSSVRSLHRTLSHRKRVFLLKEQQFAFLRVCFNLLVAGWNIGSQRSRPCHSTSAAYCWYAHTPVGSRLPAFTACCHLRSTVLAHFPPSTVLKKVPLIVIGSLDGRVVVWEQDVRASRKPLQASEVDSRRSSRLPHIADPRTRL